MTAEPIILAEDTGEQPQTFDAAQDVLAARLPGYERRPQQMALGEVIEAALANEENFVRFIQDPERPDEPDASIVDPEWHATHVMGQAGCGCGKSLAYLIPAIQSGKRVAVSVSTKALQDQIVGTDLPFLQAHLGVTFSWALLKGRSNYLCLNRLRECGEDPGMVGRFVEASRNPGFTGMREECPEVPNWFWSKVCSDQDACTGQGACSIEDDYATQARRRALDAQIIVVNHALLCADLGIKVKGGSGMLGEFQAVVLDECHTFEEIAGNSLGKTLSLGTFTHHGSEVRNYAAQYCEQGAEYVTEAIGRVDFAATELFETFSEGRLRIADLNERVSQIGDLYDALMELDGLQRNLKSEGGGDEAKKRRDKTRATMSNLLDAMASFVGDAENETVRFVEVSRNARGEEKKTLRLAPINVAPFLAQHFFSRQLVILVSATMKVSDRFDHLAGRLGIFHRTTIDVGTPFDFATQARLYVPTSAPEPIGANQGAWQSIANIEIGRLIQASNGRALVLFTSVRHMREAATTARMQTQGIEIRMQGDAPHAELVDWLKDHSTPKALFATKSFFTGVDIRGEACRLVIVSKMPFPVPTEPLTQARCEAIEAAGGSSFAHYSVPVMSLELQQAAGRLIRHTDDTGVIAILDPRILTKPYGRGIVRDLPSMPQMYQVEEVQQFFAEHPSG